MFRAVLAIGLVLFVSAVGGAEDAAPVIVSAVYGDFGKGGAKGDSARVVDVTKKVAGAVREGKVSLEVTNELFGDPAEQASKTLKVKFKIGSVESEVSVIEGETQLDTEARTYETSVVVCDIANKYDLAEDTAPSAFAEAMD